MLEGRCKRTHADPVRTWLTEIVPPRLNERTPSAVETLLQGLALDARQPFSLEVAGAPGRARFLARSASEEMHRHLLGQLRLAYPQADLRDVPLADDPALGEGAVVAAELRLRAGLHLPLRTYSDRDWQAGGADPILGILATLGDLDAGERALCQLVLSPARPDWARPLEPLALQNPVLAEERRWSTGHQDRARAHAGSGPGAGFLLLSMAGLAGWLQARAWLEAGERLPLVLAGLALAGTLWLGLLVLRARSRSRVVYDPKLVAEKISRTGYLAHLRLVAIGPDELTARARLRRLEAGYQQFGLATGNSLVAARWGGDPACLAPGHRLPWRPLPVLNVRELASLWHLPRGADEVPLVVRTGARRLLPAPVAAGAEDGCPVGVSRHQGRVLPVVLSRTALGRNLLLVAKTGRGKSTLMEHLAAWQAARGQVCVVVIDPHGDLARAVLAALPALGVRDPVWVDFADRERPVGLNLLDVYAGRSRDKIVANVIDIFSRVWERFWGPRMEDALRYCLLALCEVNQRLPPERQYGLLHVKRLLTDEPFRTALLTWVRDHEVAEWWRTDFKRMPSGFAHEVIKPVITKLNRFAGSEAARDILGQPRTTLDVQAIVRERRVLLVSTATGTLGPGTAGLLGATLLDLLRLTVMEQAALAPERRAPVRLLVDEFQTIPAVDYAALLGQLRKFGAGITLATQALVQLDASDRALRGSVFGNLDTLGAFQVSAEDARYLAGELDGLVDETDLVNLPDYHCYLKTVGPEGRRQTCLMETLPPADGDLQTATDLARRSAARYGHSVAQIEELRKAIGRQHHAWLPGWNGRGQGPARTGEGEARFSQSVEPSAAEPLDPETAAELDG